MIALSPVVTLFIVVACAGGGSPTEGDPGDGDDGGDPQDRFVGPDPDAVVFVPDGGVASDGGHPAPDAGPCQGMPESHQWDPKNVFARCCDGDPVVANTNTNCGVCGIKCNADNGESCQEFNGHWFCRGCIASTSCWSGCCATSYSPPSCSPADCNGNCRDDLCPTGSHCVGGTDTSDYCAY
ncbi:MAG TPA: hypothetical protein VK636_11655 [Gemmatimonadaceae bacterium]|nr:hypothetical protein [Gemmatimonadaceae bacterium]